MSILMESLPPQFEFRGESRKIKYVPEKFYVESNPINTKVYSLIQYPGSRNYYEAEAINKKWGMHPIFLKIVFCFTPNSLC